MRPSNTWPNDAVHTPFHQLPDSGVDGYRFVNGAFMDKEEYDLCDYRLELSYIAIPSGKLVELYRPSLAGLERYSRLKAERKHDRMVAAVTKRQADDEYSDSIQDLIDKRDVK